jgi:hypothetical protein
MKFLIYLAVVAPLIVYLGTRLILWLFFTPRNNQ